MLRTSLSARLIAPFGVSATILTLFALPAGMRADARSPLLQSAWRDQDIIIDGSNTDWKVLAPFADKVPFSIGLANDGRSLYIVLSSSDPSERMQLAMSGLIVWFDPSGGTKKQFGIKYPVIERGTGGEMRPQGGGYGRGGPGGGYGQPDRSGEPRPPAGPDFDPAKDPRWSRLEVLGPKKDDVRSLLIDHTPGVEVRIGNVEGSLVYELKIPLRTDDGHPYAIGAPPGATIGIGLETPKVEGGSPSHFGLGGFGGGMGGGGATGGMGGGPGGGREGGRSGGRGGFQPAKPLNVWATARLATGS